MRPNTERALSEKPGACRKRGKERDCASRGSVRRDCIRDEISLGTGPIQSGRIGLSLVTAIGRSPRMTSLGQANLQTPRLEAGSTQLLQVLGGVGHRHPGQSALPVNATPVLGKFVKQFQADRAAQRAVARASCSNSARLGPIFLDIGGSRFHYSTFQLNS